MATHEPQKLEPLTPDAFPESVTIPLTIRRVTSGFGADSEGRPTTIGTYALNSPHMSAPVAFVLGIPKDGYDGLLAKGDDGQRALAELIANESGNQICTLVGRGAASFAREPSVAPAAMVGPDRGALERESRALAGAKFVVDQVGTKRFDVLRVNESADPTYRVLAQCETKEDADVIVVAMTIAASDTTNEADWMDEHVTQFFVFEQLPPKLQEISRLFHSLARKVVARLPRNQQRTIALNKLVEAKDCAVRALIAKPVEQRKQEATAASKVAT